MINIENQIQKNHTLFKYYPPKDKFMGILSIPHSGEKLPDEFRPFLVETWQDLMQDVDYKVHELVDVEKLANAGVAIIYSNIIRTAVDLNRPQDTAVLNWKTNSKDKLIVKIGPEKETENLLREKYYTPYYEMLKTMITELQLRMKIPSLIDLHSMPGEAAPYHMKMNPNQDKVRPDFCLSDNHRKTCEEDFIHMIGESLANQGYGVKYNDPYVGGNITTFLNKTYVPLNNIQIEISRTLYMNEESKELMPEGCTKLKNILTNTILEHFEIFYTKYKINPS